MTNAWRRLSASRASAGESRAGISGSGRSRGCHPDQSPLGAVCQACHTPPSARSTTTTSRRPSAFGARAGGPTPAPLLGLPSDCHPDHSPRDVQVLHRPGAGGPSPRRGRAIPEPARSSAGAVRGREESDPGAGAHAAVAANGLWLCRGRDPRLRSPRDHDPVRRAGRRQWAGDLPSSNPATGIRSSSTSCARSTSKRPPDLDLHSIVDNYITHKHAKVKAWLARNPRVHMHFTPT